MPRRLSRLSSALALAATTLLLAGCFSIESTFTVNDDGTADVSYQLLVDTERLEQLSSMLGEEMGDLGDMSGDALLDEMMGGEDPCGDLESDLADYDVSSTEINNDGEVGVECTVTGVPLEEINSSMESEDGSTFTIEQDDSGTRFEATLTGVDELTGDTGEMTDMLDMSFDDLFSIVFTVSAPGSLGDNNATSTDGSTASWTITPDAGFIDGGDAVMRAEWTPGGGSSGSSALWIVLGIIAAVVVIGLIVFLLMRRNNGAGSGTADGSGPPAAAGSEAPIAPPSTTPPPPTATAPDAPSPAAPAPPPPPPPSAAPPPPPPAAPPTAPPPPPPST
jgi:hypothetical protein